MWYLLIALVTLIILVTDTDLKMTVMESVLFNETFQKKYKLTLQVIYSLLWPITLPFILYLSTKKQQIMKLAIKVIIALVLVTLLQSTGIEAVSYYNKSVDLELRLAQKKDERLTILDRVTKIVHQKLEIAKIVDSSYYKNLTAVTLMRHDGPQLAWKWIHEQNPNANFGEVSTFYKDVSNSIQDERDRLYVVEREAQETVYAYNTLRRQWPGRFYLYYRPETLSYVPISTDANRVTNRTGIDNKVNLDDR